MLRCSSGLRFTQHRGSSLRCDGIKRAVLKIWKKREKQIGVVLDNAVEMRGEIEGLVSGYKVLPSVEELTLEGIGDEAGEI